ncbi:GNAT family N-acetyltransferase [Neobacillus sp. D3-1R]|uniref:GNAT family N-acetyltransferase n=1 Tax=Neobacillus sp. D3-1R TaxID=3445778 RepID=UPI003F9FDDD4
MEEITVVKAYQHNEKLRKSFNELATSIFGIEFEDWYQHGYWSSKYIPYSVIIHDQVIANVSVNLLELVVHNNKWSAVQIGTVMTHPDFRGKGFSQLLMNTVLADYKDVDLIYLFANSSVLDFYPKFGFKPHNEVSYTLDYFNNADYPIEFTKLNGRKKEDLDIIYQHAKRRLPVSSLFGTANTAELLLYYCLNVFYENIYFLKEENTIVICKTEDNHLHVYDVICDTQKDILKLLHVFTTKETKEIVFHFTPDDQTIAFKQSVYEDNHVLFIKNNSNVSLPNHFKHPLTSQA